MEVSSSLRKKSGADASVDNQMWLDIRVRIPATKLGKSASRLAGCRRTYFSSDS
jgi:hypothetical protein